MELLKPKHAAVIYACMALLLVTGTFMDQYASSVLYPLNGGFAWFFEAYGELPFALCSWAAAALFLVGRGQGPTDERSRLTAGAVVSFLLGIVSFFEVVYHSDGIMLKVIGLVAELALSAAVFLLTVYYADYSDRDLMIRVATAIMLVCIVSFLSMQLIKVLWGRPRWRSIVVTEGLEFQPWYVWGRNLRKAFEGTLPHEEFKSFPSGHTSNSSCLLTAVLLCHVVPVLKGRERLVTCCALVWIALVMLARIIAGAHFISDVTVGFTLTFTVLLVTYRLVLQRPLEE